MNQTINVLVQPFPHIQKPAKTGVPFPYNTNRRNGWGPNFVLSNPLKKRKNTVLAVMGTFSRHPLYVKFPDVGDAGSSQLVAMQLKGIWGGRVRRINGCLISPNLLYRSPGYNETNKINDTVKTG